MKRGTQQVIKEIRSKAKEARVMHEATIRPDTIRTVTAGILLAFMPGQAIALQDGIIKGAVSDGIPGSKDKYPEFIEIVW